MTDGVVPRWPAMNDAALTPLTPAGRFAPLAPPAFAALMAGLGPFEPCPELAAGVSGGPDSLALALLLQDWLAGQGGRLTALTVDHGLRPESGAEARQVGAWLAARGIAHVILPWTGPHPRTGIQAAARAARQRLLGAWCAQAGVLHLALAHQRDDQAETRWLRAERGSGPDGLAGMAAQVETRWGRVIRPLLTVDRRALKAVLEAAGQSWIDDPSNRDPRYARVRARAALAEAGQALAAAAAESGRQRRLSEQETARWLARAATIDPAGSIAVDLDALAAAPASMLRRSIMRALITVGMLAYPPRGDRVDRLVAAVVAGGPGRPRTLGGCRVVRRGARLLIAPEAGPPDAAASSDLDGVPAPSHLIRRRQDAPVATVGVRPARFRPAHPLAGPAFAAVPVGER